VAVVALALAPGQPRAGTVCEVCGAWIALAEATEDDGTVRRCWWEVTRPAQDRGRPEHTAARCRALRTEHGQ
jgi:hypothetical protein